MACSVFNLRDASRAYAAWSEVACTSCKVGERRVVRTVACCMRPHLVLQPLEALLVLWRELVLARRAV